MTILPATVMAACMPTFTQLGPDSKYTRAYARNEKEWLELELLYVLGLCVYYFSNAIDTNYV